MAFLNSFFLVINPRETIVLVRVVPMFAPIIIGTASAIVMDPAATIATTIEVLVELLWIIAVISKPIKRPIKGLVVAKIRDWAAFFPRCLKASPMRSTANRKTAMLSNTSRAATNISLFFLLVFVKDILL